jgi:hypothetical protein
MTAQIAALCFYIAGSLCFVFGSVILLIQALK